MSNIFCTNNCQIMAYKTYTDNTIELAYTKIKTHLNVENYVKI